MLPLHHRPIGFAPRTWISTMHFLSPEPKSGMLPITLERNKDSILVKTSCTTWRYWIIATQESQGFEPWEPCGPTLFKSVAINQTLPTLHLAVLGKIWTSINGVRDRRSTVELKDNIWSRRQESNLLGYYSRRLWVLCLPIRHHLDLNKLS